MNIIEQIKAEIERRQKENFEQVCQFAAGRVVEDADILSFLSTLESEKPMNQDKELDKEIKRYLREECSDDDEPGIHEIAEHFAQWGAEHRGSSEIPKDLDEAAEKYQDDHTIQRYAGGRLLAPEFDVTVKEVFIAGAKWQADHTPLPEDTVLFNKGVAEGKRLMMEEAVDGEVDFEYFGYKVIRPDLKQLDTLLESMNHGDKVKIIIIKEDKK